MSSSQASATGGQFGARSPALALAVLIVLFVAGHLPRLVTAPSDVDELNFVLGVRDFDVSRHHPHPPGYPVFIALGKLAVPLSSWWGALPPEVAGPAVIESRALALWSTLLGALGLVPLFALFRTLDDRQDRALAATAITAAAPLYWFTAARPLSDVPGLAAVFFVDALLVAARHRQRSTDQASALGGTRWSPTRLMLTAAFAAGITAGLRSQTFWLVAPLFVVVVATWRGPRAGLLMRCALIWSIGVLAWLVPMIVVTGGLEAYVRVFREQFTEDIALVEMVSTHPTPRILLLWFSGKCLSPWGPLPLALVMSALVVLGALTFRALPPATLPLAAAFVPYLIFDLLFQEVVTVRYALPSVPLAAFLTVRGLERASARWWRPASAVLVAGCVVVGSVALLDQERDLPPVSKVLADIRAADLRSTSRPVLAMHQAYRPLMRDEPVADRILPITPLYEWLDLTRYFLDGGRAPIWFLADPRRAGLAELDPRGRRLIRAYAFAHRWQFTSALLGGSRPARVQWWEVGQPGWMLGEGWALTPEAGGVARPGRRGPHEAPAVAFIRRRPDAAVLMIGGRHLAPHDPRPVTLTASIDDRPVASWVVTPDPGGFLEWIDLAPGALAGAGEYGTLTVSAGQNAPPRVGLEQFDLQSRDANIWGFAEGWHELEYDNRRGALWRWMSDHATVVVRHAGRDVTLRLTGESPLKYFAQAPTVTIRAGDSVLLRFTPAADFSEEVTVQAARLDHPYARLVIETDRVFVPAEAGTSADRRRLGLRVYELTIQ